MSDGRSPSERATDRLATMARAQIRRDPWPDFDAFDASRYTEAQRMPAARQWWRRAREEYGSISEFTQLAHVLAQARAPIDLLAALSRLITDEARHAALCASMAKALMPGVDPEAVFAWAPPAAPWPEPPRTNEREPLLAWAADVVLCACCIGEALSRPLFEALATVITDPIPEAVVRQILRDEHLHAAFGWEALEWLRAELGDDARAALNHRLARRLAGFERTCVVGVTLEELANTELVIAPPEPSAEPNLGLLGNRAYATIFYATLETEILPRFAQLGFDADHAWRTRHGSG